MEDAIADYYDVEAGDADEQALAEAAAGADTSAGHAGLLNAQELIGILKQKEKALRHVASSSNALVSDTSNMLDDVSECREISGADHGSDGLSDRGYEGI